MKEKLLRCKDYVWRRNWLRELLSGLCFSGMLVGLDSGLRYIYQGMASMEACSYESPIPWIFTLAWAVLLTCLVRLLPGRGQKIATGVVGGFSCACFWLTRCCTGRRGLFSPFPS